MDPQQRRKITKSIDQALVFVWGILLLVFPFVITNVTTENFILPKQILITIAGIIGLLLLAARMVIAQRVRFRRTAFDTPVLIFGLALLVSSLVSLNRADALTAFVPTLLAILSYFILTNVLRKEQHVVYATSALIFSSAGIAILSIFSFFKVYPIPLALTHSASFSPLGTLVAQAVYLVCVLPLAVMLGKKILQGDTTPRTVSYAAASLVIGAGILVTLGQLLTTQKPVLLPFDVGLQTAFAAISQDTGRIVQGFFFGSGYGNFDTVFTRFKQASFNSNVYLWFFPFTQSSSFVLELLATTGVVGFLAYLLLIFRALMNPSKKRINPMYLSLVLISIASFLVPFSFVLIVLLFLILGLFACLEAIKHPSTAYDIEPKFVAVKKGLISFMETEAAEEKVEDNKIMPYGFAGILVVFCGLVLLFGGKFVLANMHIQNALNAANSNNGSLTYKEEVAGLNIFPYQSAYYRLFSQTNMALANSISLAQPKGASPSAQVQSTIYNLIQQGINTARTATNLAPLTVGNWQNLASVYRTLIGFGQGADNFAIQATQQAIALDPTNPQEFLSLGGLYYQLGQYDNAIQMFQQAVTLKQDYPNAYYNLAHAYLQKKDLQNALQALQVVQQLTVNDPQNSAKVAQEISQIQSQLGSQQTQQSAPGAEPTPTSTPATQPASVQEPLNVKGETTPIPAQTSPVPLAPSPTPTPGQ